MNFTPIFEEWPLFVSGLAVTVLASLVGSVIAIAISVLLGVASQLEHRGVEIAVRIFVYVFRGIPLLVLIFLVFYGLPAFGIVLPAFEAGIVALALCSAGYMIEVVRAALQAVDPSQKEAGQIDGASHWVIQTRIIFPQAVPTMIANGTNEANALIMATSLLSVISVGDVVRSAQQVVSIYFNPFEAYITLAVLYLAVTGIVARLSIGFERWLRIVTFASR